MKEEEEEKDGYTYDLQSVIIHAVRNYIFSL